MPAAPSGKAPPAAAAAAGGSPQRSPERPRRGATAGSLLLAAASLIRNFPQVRPDPLYFLVFDIQAALILLQRGYPNLLCCGPWQGTCVSAYHDCNGQSLLEVLHASVPSARAV